jgi:hypothetical protein
MMFAAVHESVVGTTRTFHDVRNPGRYRGKADLEYAALNGPAMGEELRKMD